MEASKAMQKYFEKLEKDCVKAYKIAEEARKKGYDPEEKVSITLARTLAERVIGLISVVAPQIQGSGAEKRIAELEKKYGRLDWRVAFIIAEEIAREKFCKFKDQTEAMEVGIRAGFAYITLGVVSAPLEGFTSLEIKDRLDGKGQYFCLNFSGPIRNAGGTAAAVSVLIGDYIRKKFGFQEYDATKKEIQRCPAELEDYHNFVTNLQYFPSKKESLFLMQRMPVEINGDPSEKRELSNVTLKDLPRVPTNRLRSGYCLIQSSCIPLKAPKLWKQLSKWGKEFDLEQWDFLEEFLKIQKKAKAKGEKHHESEKIHPDYTYIKDIVAGRPVLGHPLRSGAFRLRYGRARTSGYSGQAFHPATMLVMNDFMATATQLKVERPGKATAVSSCDSIDGPIVKLKDGTVVFLETVAQAKQHKKEVEEILYTGDVLINYGDFLNRAHVLVPSGYCQEIWIQELERKCVELFGTVDYDKLGELVNIPSESIEKLFKKPIKTKISAAAAREISEKTDVPLHPSHTFYWKSITKKQLQDLLVWLQEAKIEQDNAGKTEKIILPASDTKRVLELAGIPHLFVNKEFVVLEKEQAHALLATMNAEIKEDFAKALRILEEEKTQEILPLINKISRFTIRDKSGTFIGSRMGRPEKAKMRKMTGQPHVLFPVGEEGGRLRSFQSAMEKKKVTAQFPVYFCEHCKRETVLPVCEVCDKKAKKKKYCRTCGVVDDCEHEPEDYQYASIDINHYFNHMMKKLGTKIYPDLIKGVRGTSNKDHTPEHLLKGILRAKHSIHVNKDGTIRYDSSEVALTHFKPKEVNVEVEKLKMLGYEKDIHGKELADENQVLELKPQDVILPSCMVSPDEPCDEVMFRIANFIDELLKKFYGLKPFYNLKSKEDLPGHYVIGLAPHTSAGMLGRIVGFSKTQAFYAHPYYHAAMRRDADGDESCFLLLMDAFLNFSKKYLPQSRGSTMDAPIVLTTILDPAEVDDMAFDVDIVWRYPLSFYEAANEYKMPWDTEIKKVNDVLGTPEQFEGLGFTHDTDDFNAGVLCSAYKLLPSMQEKLKSQLNLAEKIRAVDEADVARLVIEKHFLRDIKGNLRKFSQQQFRCVACNEKFRRPPLNSRCDKCHGKVIFTVSEGSVVKYLEPSISIAEKYNVSVYLKQTLELTKRAIESIFGKEKEKQTGLGAWFKSGPQNP